MPSVFSSILGSVFGAKPTGAPAGPQIGDMDRTLAMPSTEVGGDDLAEVPSQVTDEQPQPAKAGTVSPQATPNIMQSQKMQQIMSALFGSRPPAIASQPRGLPSGGQPNATMAVLQKIMGGGR